MKWNIEKRHIRTGFIIFLLVLIALIFQYALEHTSEMMVIKETVSNTLMPIVGGLILAYLLTPILHFFERLFFTPLSKKIWRKEEKKSARMKFSRGAGIVCTMVLFLVLIIGGLYLVIPQIYQSISSIVMDAPTYYDSAVKWIDSLDADKSDISKYFLLALDHIYNQGIDYLNEELLPNMDKIVAGITSGIVGGLKILLNIVLMFIISVYVLAEKERLIAVIKKLTYGFFSIEKGNKILDGARFVDKVFGGFINGKIIDSFIIGAICYCFLVFAGLEYAVLISIIVGVTNIIPYFGPFIGAIPSALLLLMVEWKQGVIFVIFIIILQQIDGNIIGPIVLGDRLNLSSMWILFSILIGGGFFGVIGMILGAPCFACIYALISTICKSKLQEKKLPVDTKEYYSLAFVDEAGNMCSMEEMDADKPSEKGENKKADKENEKSQGED